MIDPKNKLTITRQCKLLALSRSTYYYRPAPDSADEAALMRAIDALYLERPTRGSRSMQDALTDQGFTAGRHRVRRLMRSMGLQAVYPKKRTSLPNKEHKVYPYLLRDVHINRPGQVYAADITYIPMARGFLYLVAVIDWYSRKVLSFRVSNTQDAHFCVEALQEAITRYGAPEIFNTDQGAQFTSAAFTGELKKHGVRISMDGKGRWMDNVYVERLWRSLKYEEVYLHAYEDAREAARRISRYFAYFNTERRHQGLDRQTPDAVFYGHKPAAVAA